MDAAIGWIIGIAVVAGIAWFWFYVMRIAQKGMEEGGESSHAAGCVWLVAIAVLIVLAAYLFDSIKAGRPP